jgi:hypothetical protein
LIPVDAHLGSAADLDIEAVPLPRPITSTSTLAQWAGGSTGAGGV